MNLNSDVAAEEALLGTAMESPKRAMQLVASMRANDFALGKNAAAFRAIESVVARGDRPDVVTVHAEIGGDLWSVADLEIVRQRADRLSFEQHMRIVQGHAASRAVLQACADAEAMVRRQEPAGLVLERMAAALAGIATRRDDKLTSIGEVIPGVIEAIEERRKNPGATVGLMTGVMGLDEMLNGAQPGQLIVIAGDAGAGKTSLAMQWELYSAKQQDAAWLNFNLEMLKGELVERKLAHEARKDSHFLRKGALTDASMAEIRAAGSYLSTLPIFLEDQCFNFGDIIAKARAWRARYPQQRAGIVMDYLQLASSPDHSAKRNEEVGAVARGMKRLAKELQVPVVLLSQLNRDGKKADRPPTKHDLRDSGTIEDDADVIILGHAIGEPDPRTGNLNVNQIVDKQRGGPTGTVPTTFVRKNYLFEDAAMEGSFE